ETHPRICPAELRLILATRQQVTAEEDVPRLAAATLLKSKNVWLLMGQYFCSNFTFFFCLSWLFPYLKAKYNLGMVETGFYSAAPPLAGAFGNWFAGALVDWIYRRNNWIWSRRLPAVIGFALAAGGLISSIYMETPLGAIVCLSIAVFGADMTLAPSWSVCIDVGRRAAGTVSGTMNMAGNLGSFVTSLAFPYLLAWSGTHDAFFLLGAGLNGLAVFAWLLTRPDRPLEEY
ncbi:MAG TPA: MFS transporter, partial [Phycisphaerae bacterium]|nr:MFS transporter [Phycisphaerae bacterium]